MPTTIADPAPLRHVPAASSGIIRPFAAADAREVADLLIRGFQNSDRPAPTGMADYLREVYLDAPWFDPEIASRVLVRADGRIAGFVGVAALPMLLDGRRIRTAIISSLAVDPRTADSMTAPRLLRDVRSGVQDAILSDRSNGVAVALLRSLRADVFRNYSLDWLRVLRPAALAIDTLASRVGVLRLLAPLAAPFDNRRLAHGQASEEPRWITPSRARAAEAFTDRDADLSELLTLVPRFLAEFPLRPDWSAADLTTILSDGARKAEFGDFTSRVVLAPNGEPAGLFLTHLRRGRVAQVLQIMAQKGREGVVIDRAIAHAVAAGAVAIRGRAQPALLDALMERRVVFLPELAAVVYSRDADILRHFREGTAFFTGLAGENWMRLNGDRF
ncbi:MAG: GNAT family N-acetyltransferase [Devosia sp.]|nr:GNAT family N-acetyltransferase [Devosia sp.]